MPIRKDAIAIYEAAVAAVQPAQLINRYIQLKEQELYIEGKHIPINKNQKIYVIGAGKAAAAMAQETEKILGEKIHEGFIITKYGHTLPLQKILCLEAAHPVPDENSVLAVKETIKVLQKTNTGDLVICLLSGGASSLWADVPEGVTLQELVNLFQALLVSGANIAEMNIVRKHLSTIKGGQLLGYAPGAMWFGFIISDVPGNKSEVIASGPTVADSTTFEEALQVIYKYGLQDKIPASVLQHLENGKKGNIPETVKPGNPLLANAYNAIIGSNALALQAAKQKANELGYQTVIHDDNMLGDGAMKARDFILACKSYNGTLPACLLMGGETTVTVTGNGKGGRNMHFTLAGMLEMMKRREGELHTITLLSAGSDGSDGPTDVAGAVADIETITMAVQKNWDPQAFLDNNDSFHFFQQAGGLIKTGATQTNVMDIVVALIC